MRDTWLYVAAVAVVLVCIVLKSSREVERFEAAAPILVTVVVGPYARQMGTLASKNPFLPPPQGEQVSTRGIHVANEKKAFQYIKEYVMHSKRKDLDLARMVAGYVWFKRRYKTTSPDRILASKKKLGRMAHDSLQKRRDSWYVLRVSEQASTKSPRGM